jgi:hypothetical protein
MLRPDTSRRPVDPAEIQPMLPPIPSQVERLLATAQHGGAVRDSSNHAADHIRRHFVGWIGDNAVNLWQRGLQRIAAPNAMPADLPALARLNTPFLEQLSGAVEFRPRIFRRNRRRVPGHGRHNVHLDGQCRIHGCEVFIAGLHRAHDGFESLVIPRS